MDEDRFCKRCSVTRVNMLSRIYESAHGDGASRKFKGLKHLVEIAKKRGYDKAEALMSPGLEGRELRALCWNVSSFLKDDEVSIFATD